MPSSLMLQVHVSPSPPPWNTIPSGIKDFLVILLNPIQCLPFRATFRNFPGQRPKIITQTTVTLMRLVWRLNNSISRKGLHRRHKGSVCQIHEQMISKDMVGAYGKKQNSCLQLAERWPMNEGFILWALSDLPREGDCNLTLERMLN